MIGTYGVFSYKILRRTQEIGLRMALGATSSDILRAEGKQAAAQIVLGILLGLGGAVALTRFMTSALAEIHSGSPELVCAVAIVLGSIGLIASYMAVRKATRVSPITALRYE